MVVYKPCEVPHNSHSLLILSTGVSSALMAQATVDSFHRQLAELQNKSTVVNPEDAHVKSLTLLHNDSSFIIRTTRTKIRALRKAKPFRYHRCLPIRKSPSFTIPRWFLCCDQTVLSCPSTQLFLQTLSSTRGETLLHILGV